MNELLLNELNLWKALSAYTLDSYEHKLLINPSMVKSGFGFMNIAIHESGEIFNSYTPQELSQLKNKFEEMNSEGNVIVKNFSKPDFLEHSSYYLKLENKQALSLNEYSIIETKSFRQFATIVAQGFGFGESFVEPFTERMKKMDSKLDSRFFFLQKNKENVACCSFFRANTKDLYCAMNGCTLEEYRGENAFSVLMSNALKILDFNVYGRTNNPLMESALCKIGFEKINDFYIVPIKKL